MTRTEIAASLNAKGIKNSVGKSWTMFALTAILKNEVYLGNVVYNRRSKKVGENKLIANPPDMWIRRDGAFESIISVELFRRTQEVFEELKGGRIRSDEKLLSDLSALLKREGRLTLKIMQGSKGLANSGVYLRRFGSLAAAYKKVGYEPEKRYDFGEIQKEFNKIICDASKSFALSLEKCGMRADFMPELYLLTINQSMRISVCLARAISNGVCTIKTKRWEARSLRFKRSDLTLIVRMDEQNQNIKDYFLMPTPSLKATVDGRIRVTDFSHGSFKHEQLGELVKAAADYIQHGYFADGLHTSIAGPAMKR